jgi:hypothetical protein
VRFHSLWADQNETKVGIRTHSDPEKLLSAIPLSTSRHQIAWADRPCAIAGTSFGIGYLGPLPRHRCLSVVAVHLNPGISMPTSNPDKETRDEKLHRVGDEDRRAISAS